LRHTVYQTNPPALDYVIAGMKTMAPDVLVPAHCTGWNAQQRLAAALTAAFVPNAVGISSTLAP
jgi:7,8-dihydropterin-6-yl-methyl-4-(beta-D-ribofuranosyl)aminobenzene 5'-phosphate synthase